MPTTNELTGSVGTGATASVQSLGSRPDESSPLDWVGFCAGSFPGRRPRHDFQAAEAYEIYRRTFAASLDQALVRGKAAISLKTEQDGEIVQSEQQLDQAEAIMESLVARGFYTGSADSSGEGRSYREAPRVVETSSRLASQDQPRELNDVLKAWADEDAENDVDVERFDDEAGQ